MSLLCFFLRVINGSSMRSVSSLGMARGLLFQPGPKFRVTGSVWGVQAVWQHRAKPGVWPEQGRGNYRLVLLTYGLCFTVGLRWDLLPGELLQYLLSLGFCSPFECWSKSFYGIPPASYKASSWHLSSIWVFLCLSFAFLLLSFVSVIILAFFLTVSFLCEDVKISS